MVTKNRPTRLKSLSQGRPPTVKAHKSISRKATRTLIRSHHTLEKQRARAVAKGDSQVVANLTRQIDLQGGIKGYQQASLLGQSSSRGGDSSKVLMNWLAPLSKTLKECTTSGIQLRMLEVGALSGTNACSKSHIFEMERIDLNSQANNITQQDFLERPIPDLECEKFDIISLSLVLNYVPDAIQRGHMLRRTTTFLRLQGRSGKLEGVFPALFLVLPAPCVLNSRYLDEARLEAIMESLGYVKINKKLSPKLVYYLWKLKVPDSKEKERVVFKKQEVRTGKTRNNFTVILQ